jgi:thiol-disulfide isomerase/thioredoxin
MRLNLFWYIQAAWRSIPGMMLIVLITGALAWAAPPTPPVPEKLPAALEKSRQGRVVLLDFYATWCGACRWLNPYLASIQKHAGRGAFLLQHLDVDEARNRMLTQQYHIDSTPSLFLYDSQGRLTFLMRETLDPWVLSAEVFRLTGRSGTVPRVLFPKAVFPATGPAIHWFSIGSHGCCPQRQPTPDTLTGLDQVMHHPFGTPIHPGALRWLKQHGVNDPGSSVITDRRGRVLFLAGPRFPLKTLSRYVQSFNAGEVAY